MLENSGNRYAWNILRNMTKNDRPAHGVLLYGERGTGKKHLANDYAAMLLCTAEEGLRPCGKCKACLTVKKNMHPDVFTAAKTGKLGAFTVGEAFEPKEGTVRDMRSKLYEYPSEGRSKILIFPDCTNVGSWNQVQNMLLKILEEPPEYGYIIFTAPNKDIFLQTILSRIISLPVSRCTEEETEKILSETVEDYEKIKESVEICGGNIGKCLDYINDPFEKEKISLIDSFFKSIKTEKSYQMLLSLSPFCKDRKKAAECIEAIVETARDSAVLQSCGKLETQMGLSRKTAKYVADNIMPGKIEQIYRAGNDAANALRANIRADFVISAMCADITCEN